MFQSQQRHSGSSYVGSRLADADDDIVPVISKHVPNQPAHVSTRDNNSHVVMISPCKVPDPDPYRELLDLCGSSSIGDKDVVNSLTCQTRGVTMDTSMPRLNSIPDHR